MKYVVIGLGDYGRVLTAELTERGHDVVCADNVQSKVEMVKNDCAMAMNIDATDELAMSMLPLKGVDAVFVAIGGNLGASIRIVALLKKFKVAHIYARAIDNVHKSILQAFDIDKILLPEEEAASNLVRQMDFGANVDTFEIDTENRIFKFACPELFVGVDVNSIEQFKEFNLKLLSVVHGTKARNCINVEYSCYEQVQFYNAPYTLSQEDKLVCMGKATDFLKFCRRIK